MIEIQIQMDPQGQIKFGHSPNASTVQLVGMLEIVKTLVYQQQVKPKEPSGLVSPVKSPFLL